MATELPKQQAMWLVPIVSGNLHSKYQLNMAQDKGVIEVSLWLPWQPSYYSNEVSG